MATGTGPFRCPRCGAATWGNLRHCSGCGQSLYLECSECGARWRYIYTYTFCPACGAKAMKVAG